MPKYIIRRDTYISHEGLTVRAGEEVSITWPPGCEPKAIGDNMELVAEDKAPAKGAKKGGEDLT